MSINRIELSAAWTAVTCVGSGIYDLKIQNSVELLQFTGIKIIPHPKINWNCCAKS